MQVKKIVFSNPPEDHVFGYMPTPDPEGAREITMIWKSHQPSPGEDFCHAFGLCVVPACVVNAAPSMRYDPLARLTCKLQPLGQEARPDGKPNLDFTKMNKLAAQRCVGVGAFTLL